MTACSGRIVGEVAAVVVEPLVQGAAGMIVHPEGYLSGLRELTRKHDTLLIADEVAVGFGRTGTLFACEQEGVAPDILCLAKGLTGGYLPLAATLTTDAIYSAFVGTALEGKTFYHGHTYGGNPLGAAAALGALQVFDDEKTLETMVPKVARLSERLVEFCRLSARRSCPSARADRRGRARRRQGVKVAFSLVASDRRYDLSAGARVGPFDSAAGRRARDHAAAVGLARTTRLDARRHDTMDADHHRARGTSRMSLPGLFVIGTDTGVGKTHVAASIARVLRSDGRRVGVLKPVSTGSLHSEDAQRLAEAVGGDIPIGRIAPIVFEEALAPSIAARRAGQPLMQPYLESKVGETLSWWSERADLMVVEGIGGLLCPLAEGTTVADLAITLDYPLVIVARRGLGTLNHTLMTIEAARMRSLRIAGVVLNSPDPESGDLAEETAHGELARRLPGIALLAELGHASGDETLQSVELVRDGATVSN